MTVPPGSRVTTCCTPLPRRCSASMRTCVVFPDPSIPSNVMKPVDVFGKSSPLRSECFVGGVGKRSRGYHRDSESGEGTHRTKDRVSPAVYSGQGRRGFHDDVRRCAAGVLTDRSDSWCRAARARRLQIFVIEEAGGSCLSRGAARREALEAED